MDSSLKGWKVDVKMPTEKRASQGPQKRLPQKHWNICPHTCVSATHLIYVVFIVFDLINCSGQIPTVYMSCRSMESQNIEKVKIFFKSPGWVQEQLRQAGQDIGEGALIATWRSQRAWLWVPSCVLPGNSPEHFSSKGIIMPLQEGSECWCHFSALKGENYIVRSLLCQIGLRPCVLLASGDLQNIKARRQS